MNSWPLAALQDRGQLIERLARQQLSPEMVEQKAARFARVGTILADAGVPATAPVIAFFVPGRIEVLGKHTDYAGGRSMVAAVERGFCLAAVARSDRQMAVTDAVTGQSARFLLDPDLKPPEGDWSNYPMTVARRVARNFTGPLRGADIALTSDLSPAAGMSSSSALMVATFMALAAVNRLTERDEYVQNIDRREDLAGYLGTVENGQSFGTLTGDLGVGTFGGSEDHTAILCARPGQISQYSYCPVCFERSVALPASLTFVIGVSGVVAEKTGAAMAQYNRASQLARAVVDTWCRATGRTDPHLAAAIGSGPDAAERIRQTLRSARHDQFDPLELLDRFEQFLAESEEIIPGVADRLDESSLEEFGRLVDRSQTLGAQRLKNQVPETVFLAEHARRIGAAAASAFGAGFGGSVWALVDKNDASELCEAWSAAYADAYPQHAGQARFEISPAGPPVFFLSGPDDLQW